MRRRDAALAVVLLALGFAATLTLEPWSDERITDVVLYQARGDQIGEGELPYRDFLFEYPPLAAPLLALPELFVDGYDDYRALFAGLMFAAALGLLFAVGAIARRTGGSAAVALLGMAALPLLLGAVVRTRFDLAPALAAALALALVLGGRVKGGMAVAGLGALLKAFPLLVATAALPWLWGRGERRAARDGALTLAAVLVVGVGAWVAISPSGAWDSVSYHLDRPVQVESSPAAALYVAAAAGAEPAGRDGSHGSDNLVHPAADALAIGFAIAALATIVAAAALVARRPGGRALALAALVQITALGAFGKVLSPQFLIWMAPLMALSLAWRMWSLAGCLVAATALTLAEFPGLYGELVARNDVPLTILIVRDELLLAAVALGLRALWREPRLSPEARPAPAPV